MPKLNSKRYLIAIIVGIIMLNIIMPVQGLFDYWFNTYSGLPQEIIVEKNIGFWMIGMMLCSILFEVFIPMTIYVLLVEKLLKKSSLLYGLLFGLICFFVGSLPHQIFLPMFIKVQFGFAFVRTIWSLIDLTLVGLIIGGVYKPLDQDKDIVEEEERSGI